MFPHSRQHQIDVVHPFPDRPFDFRTNPRDATTAAFDPDRRSTVYTSVPVAGHVTLLQQQVIFGWATSEPELLADALGPCHSLDPDGDTLGHDSVILLDGDGLRIFHARIDSDPRRTGQYSIVETRVPGQRVDDPRPDLAVVARIPFAADAAAVASIAMLDEPAAQAASPFNTWPVFRPRLGDTAIDLTTFKAASSGSGPVEQTSGETKWWRPRSALSQTGAMK